MGRPPISCAGRVRPRRPAAAYLAIFTLFARYDDEGTPLVNYILSRFEPVEQTGELEFLQPRDR